MEPAPGATPPAETPAPAPPKRPVKVYVIVLAILIALAGFAVWWVFFKPYTIAQLDAMARECVPTGSLCQIPEGRTIYVAGTVTRLDLVNVSTGVRTAVFLDGGGPLLFAGDRRSQFAVGQSTTVPLLIRVYRYNGIEYRSADEYPLLPLAIQTSVIFSAISRVAGITFLPVSSGPDTLTLEVAAHRGEAFLLSYFRFCLIDVQGPLFLAESGYTDGCAGRDEVDGWTPGGNGSSPSGRMAFSDLAGNGLLDVRDRITVSGTPTGSPYDLDSKFLAVNNASSGILQGFSYFFETSAGIAYYPDPLAVNPGTLQMWTPGNFALGPPENIDRFGLTVARGPAPALGNMSYLLRDELGAVFSQGRFAAGTFFTSGGMTGTYDDADGDDHASVGDRLEFRGGQTNGHYTLQIQSGSGLLIDQLQWRSGRGAYTGNFPLVAFQAMTRVNATTVEADPVLAGGFPWEETANFTLELRQGTSLVVSLDLRTATNGTSSGQTLRFLSGGDPTHLDAGDRIRAEGLLTGVTYNVRVLYTPPGPSPRLSGTWTIPN